MAIEELSPRIEEQIRLFASRMVVPDVSFLRYTQYRHVSILGNLLLLLRELIIKTGWGAILVTTSIGTAGFEGVADTALRHPGGGGDRSVGCSALTQSADSRDDGCR